jgi:phosphate-selective porin OprO and OprP
MRLSPRTLCLLPGLLLAVAARPAVASDDSAGAAATSLQAAVETAAEAAVSAAPVPAPTPTPEASPVTPKPRKLWEGDDGAIRMLNRVQLRWSERMPDDKSVNAPEGGEFRIRRAKTEFTGWVLNEHFTYELQLSWAGPEPGASTQTALEDLILSWDASKDGRFKLTGGQFKVPLGRQEMTSSGRLQFCDRDILSMEFTRGRDIGLEFGGELLEGKFEYAAGIFNGNAASHLGNDNDKYQYNARAMFQPWGKVGYSEGDFESTDKPLLAIAIQFEHNDQRRAGTAVSPSYEPKTVLFGGDLSFKFKGFSAWGEFFLRDRTPAQGSTYNSNGFHGALGYFILRDRLEAAFRYARWDPSDQIANNLQSEWGLAANYFIRKHGLKLQSDFREIENKVRATKDHELRVQAQVMF